MENTKVGGGSQRCSRTHSGEPRGQHAERRGDTGVTPQSCGGGRV